MAQDSTGNKHGAVTTTNAQGVTTSIIVEKEVVDGKVVTKSAKDVGVVNNR